MDAAILIVLFGSSAWMTAISWFVGAVHYPGFRAVEAGKWEEYHLHHTKKIGPIVALPMIGQVLSSAYLCLDPDFPASVKAAILICAVFTIGWTGAVSGPFHVGLTQNPPERLNKLIDTNWVRTLAWAILAVLSAFQLISA